MSRLKKSQYTTVGSTLKKNLFFSGLPPAIPLAGTKPGADFTAVAQHPVNPEYSVCILFSCISYGATSVRK